jgi:hypothetical protein
MCVTTVTALNFPPQMSYIIICMTKLLNSDWLRGMQWFYLFDLSKNFQNGGSSLFFHIIFYQISIKNIRK